MDRIDALTIEDLTAWIKSNPVPSGKYFKEVSFDTGKNYVEAALYHEHQNRRDDNFASLMITYDTELVGNFCFNQTAEGELCYLGEDFTTEYSELWNTLKTKYADIKNVLDETKK